MALVATALLADALRDGSPAMPAYNLPPGIARNLGPYSARYSVEHFGNYPSITHELPGGCQVTQVNILHRHGARFPVTGQTKDIKAALDKIYEAVSKHPEVLRDTPLNFLSDWKLPDGSNALVDFGRKSGYTSGLLTAKTYQSLAVGGGIFIRATNIDRVMETSRWFRHGFNGGPYPTERRSLEMPDVVIPVGANNTLSCKISQASEMVGDRDKDMTPVPQSVHVADRWLAIYAPPIVARLQSYIPGLTLTNNDVRYLMLLCGFETAYLGEENISQWCAVFTKEEWAKNEYWYDLDKYWRRGYGSPVAHASGSGWVNELVARLTGSPVRRSGCVNNTLDSNRATFPLPPTAPLIFADFSSDNNIASIMSALGILQDTIPLSPLGPPPADRLWVVSKLVPFATKLVVEKISCDATGHEQDLSEQEQVRPPWRHIDGHDLVFDDTEESILSKSASTKPFTSNTTLYIRIILNDAVVPVLFDGCGDLASSNGMCDLDAFLRAQGFSNNGGD
ncbi:hypothetical protein FRB96_005628 [Tulasnella sp. 330]|nr:hypothetical protein FRB96_005628 [Tulasnella sp. 330]KAG8890744.1 hypothetical protein FRB98_004789 [Tulasnella sp. 332]